MSLARGTSNGNVSGNSQTRRARKAKMVRHWAAEVDLLTLDEWQELFRVICDETKYLANSSIYEYLWVDVPAPDGHVAVSKGLGRPACRCFRCGKLLTAETVTCDRHIEVGGTYSFWNLRPACGSCNSITGNEFRWARHRKLLKGRSR